MFLWDHMYWNHMYSICMYCKCVSLVLQPFLLQSCSRSLPSLPTWSWMQSQTAAVASLTSGSVHSTPPVLCGIHTCTVHTTCNTLACHTQHTCFTTSLSDSPQVYVCARKPLPSMFVSTCLHIVCCILPLQLFALCL